MIEPFINKILVAVNGSQSAIEAAMYAIMMAKANNLSVKFVYVVDTSTVKYLGMNQAIKQNQADEFQKELTAEAEHHLEYVKGLAASKGLECEIQVRCGTVYAEINKAAAEFESDVIFVGADETNTKKSGLGGMNSRVKNLSDILTNAKLPVFVIRDKNIPSKFESFVYSWKK